MNIIIQIMPYLYFLIFGLLMLYIYLRSMKRCEQFWKSMVGIRERTFIKELKRLEGDKQ